MATILEKYNSKGDLFFEIRVSRGRNKSRLTKTWTPPTGWSLKASRREAQKQAVEFESAVKSGLVLDKKEKAAKEAAEKAEEARLLTFRQFTESVFMPMKTASITENTRYTYATNLRKWIFPVIGDYKLAEITAAMVSALLLDMQEKGMAHSTVIKNYNLMNGVFKMAYMQDMTPSNVMDKVPRPKARKDDTKTAPQSLTSEEVKALLEFMEGEPLQWRVFIHVLLDTGIRRGEACAIEWGDIDFESGTILISKSLNYTADKGTFLSGTKNGRSRTVYVGSRTLSLLRQLRREQAQACVSKYVFTQHESAAPIHAQTPTEYVASLSKRCGIKMHVHTLRHTFASLALQSGADVPSVSEVLGHSDTSVTLRVYAHASDESRKRAASLFRKAIGEE